MCPCGGFGSPNVLGPFCGRGGGQVGVPIQRFMFWCLWSQSVRPSVCQEQKQLSLKRDDQGSVRTLQLRDPNTAEVGVSAFRTCLSLCLLLGLTLTRLPRSPAEVEGDHIGGSAGESAASYGETEVPALPENDQQPVRSHPAGIFTSCPDRLLHLSTLVSLLGRGF